MSASRYVYEPLDVNQSVIRTVRLMRYNIVSEQVRCGLDITVFNDGEDRSGSGVPYEALSYTWGDVSAAPQNILVNGHELPVTANLHCALLHLRQPKQDRVLWIDAICIDQKNTRERTHQVGLMKRIYGQAETVLIWLGPATQETRIAMRYLLQVDQAVRQSDRRLDTPDAWRDEFERSGQGNTAVAHAMLSALFESPWFSRIWVIQEAASAKAALVMYGRDAVPARTFAMLSTLPSVHVPEGAKAALEVMPSPLKKMSWWRDRRDLLTLLCKFRNHEARDPRDKVYALLGIAETGEGEPQIKADYRADDPEVSLQVKMLIASYLFPDPSMPDQKEVYRDIRGYFGRLPGSVDQIATSVFHWAVQNGRPSLVTALVREMPDLDPNAYIPCYGPPLCMLAKRGFYSDEDAAKELLEYSSVDKLPERPNIGKGVAKELLKRLNVEDFPKRPNADDFPKRPNTDDFPESPGANDFPGSPGADDFPGSPGADDFPKRSNVDDVLSVDWFPESPNIDELVERYKSVAKALLEHPNIGVNVRFKGNTPLNLAMSMHNFGMIGVLATHKDVDIWNDSTDMLHQLRAAMLGGLSMEPAAAAAAEAFIKHTRVWENKGAMDWIAHEFPDMLKRIGKCRLKMYSHQLWEEINSGQENIKLIEHYIDEGADVNYLPEAGRGKLGIDLLTPLGVAAKKGSMATAKVLLAKGADLDPWIGYLNFMSPLTAAAAAGHTDVVRLLLDAGAHDTNDALRVAARKGHTGITRLIKERASDPEKRRLQPGSLKMFGELRGYSPRPSSTSDGVTPGLGVGPKRHQTGIVEMFGDLRDYSEYAGPHL